MRAVQRTLGILHAQLAGQLIGLQPAVIVFALAQFAQRRELRLQPLALFGIARRAVQHAALAVIAGDTFTVEHAPDFIGNVVQQRAADHPLASRQTAEQAVIVEQVTHQPAAIAPRGAKAGNLGLDHDDAQVRGLGLQVVGGPQAGVAGADDRHIGVNLSRQRRARRQRFFQLVHPQADAAPVAHAGYSIVSDSTMAAA